MAGTNGFVPLRRGIVEHLGDMTGNEVKLYDYLLCVARPRDGEVRLPVRTIAQDLKMSPSRCLAALNSLRDPHGSNGVRYVDYEPGRNQHDVSVVRILKWRQGLSAVTETDTARSTARSTAAEQQRNSSGTAAEQHDPPEQVKDDPYSHESHESQESRGKAAVYSAIEQATGSVLSSADQTTVAGWLRTFPEPLVLDAITRAAAKGKARVPYIGGIIAGLAEEGWKPQTKTARLTAANSVPCPECRASGDVYDASDNLVPCPECKGRGRIPRSAS